MPQQVPSIKQSSERPLNNQQQKQQPGQEEHPISESKPPPQQSQQHSTNGRNETNELDNAQTNCPDNDGSNNSINGGQQSQKQQSATSGADATEALGKQKTVADLAIAPIDDNSNNDNSRDNNNDQIRPHESKPQQQVVKLNGLKNRIIQRPPPLVLDNVSNDYYTSIDNYAYLQPKQQRHHHYNHSLNHATITRANSDANIVKPDQEPHQVSSSGRSDPLELQQTETEAYISDRTSSSSNANQKFWASLNENASRNKALANASTAATPIDSKSFSSSTLPLKQTKDTTDSLGLDLIIKHRNSNSSSQLTSRSRRYSNQHSQQHTQRSGSRLHSRQSIGEDNQKRAYKLESEIVDRGNHQVDDNHRYQRASSSLNELDHDQAASENGGGNLIGVDNTTPPAFETQTPETNLEIQPASASSSRPRSNNPFLDDDNIDNKKIDKFHTNYNELTDVETSPLLNNFNKRPASFIAATADRSSSISKSEPNRQEPIDEKFNELNLYDLHSINSTTKNQTFLDQSDSQVSYSTNQVSRMKSQAQNPFVNQMNSHQPIYGSNNYYESNEPGISLDSESAVCQPPPSATMQLPHWTEAIYELNNAILETSSVAGGAENGQFIYIAESGDIILELDQVKVSGFTLLEFNELVVSKQFHLLSATQTKHSYGLTNDLKDYLNSSFPKDSKDRELQNVIRDNIYRRTIPCTTRPPRQGEIDKVDYHFLTKEQFIDLNSRNMLLECGVYGDHYYGTLKPLCDINDLSIHSSMKQQDVSDSVRQSWDANHPAVGLVMTKNATLPYAQTVNEYPLYENYESLRRQQQQVDDIYSKSVHYQQPSQPNALAHTEPPPPPENANVLNIVAVDSEALPPGWQRVVDQTHGTYYIDHNTKRTQYERPYEVELTKGSMGFGFTLVEADNGLLLVRSIIHGGPAHMNGSIRPGDILVSAVGVPVTGLQHTDIARLFSTFAVGDPVRLTFARSNYVLDESLVPDEYLFSNGTDGNMAVAFNPNNQQPLTKQQMMTTLDQSHHILVDQEFDFATITLKRGDQGFGFTISDSIAGQKVRKIQNHEVCSNLKQGDILMSLDGQDISKLTHKEVVEQLKKYTPGENVALLVKRKKRFRSKTPTAMHTDANSEYSLDTTPQRNCKTPSLDGLMLKRLSDGSNPMDSLISRRSMQQPSVHRTDQINGTASFPQHSTAVVVPSLSAQQVRDDQQIYGSLPQQYSTSIEQQPVYYNQQSLPTNINSLDLNNEFSSIMRAPKQMSSSFSNSVQASEATLSRSEAPIGHNRIDADQNQINQYNDFMNNDKFVMMQMQQHQQGFNHLLYSSDYSQVPSIYAHTETLRHQPLHAGGLLPTLPIKPPSNPYYASDYSTNYYANNEEIARQNLICGGGPLHNGNQLDHSIMSTTNGQFDFPRAAQTPHDEHDEYEYHHVELVRENTDSNWGIRLIGGAEVDRAISIGSMIAGGVAAKSGKLKSGDEIISIDGVSVVGATHQDVVKLISACTVRVLLVVRRKAFAEACDVVLSKNIDEGFGFVIISSENCALIGKIIEGSPADRCKQLRVRDCIIAVNGRFITPDMKHPEIVNMIKECGSTLRLRIIPVDCYTVKLIKDLQRDSFGFRMRGGSEYDGTPLYIVRVEQNGQAHGLLNVGDQILEINNIPTVGMTHQQAATIIKYSDPIVKLKLRRNFETPPSLLVDSPRALQKYNQVTAEMKTVNRNATPNPMLGCVDSAPDAINYSSLPIDITMVNQQHCSNFIGRMQNHIDGHQDHTRQQQPIYEDHSLNYSGSNTLYAT